MLPTWFLAALLSIALAATGQVLLKLGVQRAFTPDVTTYQAMFLAALREPRIACGVAAFAASMVVWLAAISGQQLSRVYPMAAIGYVLVTIASVRLFHDTVTPGKIAGIALIVIGIVVLNVGSPAASAGTGGATRLAR
jgi:multidrug transporter EmrE-like cation transporter